MPFKFLDDFWDNEKYSAPSDKPQLDHGRKSESNPL